MASTLFPQHRSGWLGKGGPQLWQRSGALPQLGWGDTPPVKKLQLFSSRGFHFSFEILTAPWSWPRPRFFQPAFSLQPDFSDSRRRSRTARFLLPPARPLQFNVPEINWPCPQNPVAKRDTLSLLRSKNLRCSPALLAPTQCVSESYGLQTLPPVPTASLGQGGMLPQHSTSWSPCSHCCPLVGRPLVFSGHWFQDPRPTHTHTHAHAQR